MTKDKLLDAIVLEAIKENQYQADRSDNQFYKEAYQNLADYLSQHPVMQEGKEDLTADDWNNTDFHTQAKIPTDDEQPEVRQCQVCGGLPTVNDNTCSFCTPRSQLSNDMELPPNYTEITGKFIEQARD